MPEATVDKDRYSLTYEYEIRHTRQFFDVKAIPEARFVQPGPHN